MLKTIKIDLTAVESLLFFGQLILEKEKVSELYILRITELPPLKLLTQNSSPYIFTTGTKRYFK